MASVEPCYSHAFAEGRLCVHCSGARGRMPRRMRYPPIMSRTIAHRSSRAPPPVQVVLEEARESYPPEIVHEVRHGVRHIDSQHRAYAKRRMLDRLAPRAIPLKVVTARCYDRRRV